ncbi:MAG: RNA polymerase factor sigma-54 [Xanthomonadales bacterium]|nr:RNA polymerase factor sigma-54 [Xanthomonadales bacterium]
MFISATLSEFNLGLDAKLMAQRLQLKLKQQLSMAPQLQQAIKLLQLGRIELRDYVQEALDSNPLLEREGEESPDPDFVESNESSSDEPSTEEWLSSQGLGSTQSSSASSGYILDSLPDQDDASLQSHLLWQINLTSFSDIDSAIAEAIVFALDGDGYLADSIEDIQQSLQPEVTVSAAEVTAVLHRIQRMEPVGVACADARECIQVQLAALPQDTPGRNTAAHLARDGLDLLIDGQLDDLIERLNTSREKIILAIELIQSLEPRPGSRYDNRRDEYIVPDVYFLQQDSGWGVSLNPENEPRLQLNNYYIQLLRSEGKKESDYLQGHLQEARWLMNALILRNRSLMLVSNAIVQHQQKFLEGGDKAMQPLVLREIAAETGLHESTVSRATTRKYALTPRGIFELKYFFSSHVNTQDGKTVSSVAVKARIAELISAESVQKPLSDLKISEQLQDSGIRIARRTVAKYREALGIGSSAERRRNQRREKLRHF